ncbi:MAG: tetratricopeptide repeat protein [Sinobacteraceae bacterium]|nr:tetratricopeptide repeat protein [Nevskiaceae bacterium]
MRRSAQTIRITAQLNDAVSGFHLWSQTYDRGLGDVLKLQSEIADAVAGALRVTLLGSSAATVELGSTHNPVAFDAYLRGLRLARTATTRDECQVALDAFSQSIRTDPNYALAYAHRAYTVWNCASHLTGDWLNKDPGEQARSDAQRAISLAPTLAEGYIALGYLASGQLDFFAADQACQRALALAPNNDQVLRDCSNLAGEFGHFDTAVALARRGVALDPLNALTHRALGDTLRYARRYPEAIAAYQEAVEMDKGHSAEAYARLGIVYFLMQDLAKAQSSCEARPDYFESRVCCALVYAKTNRQTDARAALQRVVDQGGDGASYQYVQVHTQWGEHEQALAWLEKAMRLRDPGLIYLRIDPLLDPLRGEMRFRAVERQLKFPPAS